MSKKLYVGNLPYSVDDNQLSEIFSEAGSVESATVISDKFSGRSKGFGFVEFSNDDEGQAAIDKFNGTDVDGRAIVVNEARPMKPRDDGPRE
jgi:RNA recognition motif-containing protein|tara:strand:+ start:1976 stop:2251 length:276 start_codon:yes stop_codon:yes gene_type:complete